MRNGNVCVSGGIVAFTILLLAGCGTGGGPVAKVSGTVTLKGKPIPAEAQAFIAFSQGTGAKTKSASVPIVGGKYECTEVPTGDVRVLFEISRPIGPKRVSERTGQEFQEQENLVPARYASGETITVGGDKTDQNFDLVE